MAARADLVNALVYSSSLAAAFLGGILALFAPCCVVSVLPTFVGAALERGRMRLPVTAAIFAAGIATVMLPIVLGIGLLGELLAAHHREVFFVVGLVLALLGIQVLSGRPWSLPLPMLRLRVSGSSFGGIYTLGLTSGFASSCCAPVLAGVAAMSALAGTVPGSLGLGLAYVFGMVFPLLIAVPFGDRLDHKRKYARFPQLPRIRLGGRRLPWSDALAAAMFLSIGGLALYIAYTGQTTYLPDWLASWNRFGDRSGWGSGSGLERFARNRSGRCTGRPRDRNRVGCVPSLEGRPFYANPLGRRRGERKSRQLTPIARLPPGRIVGSRAWMQQGGSSLASSLSSGRFSQIALTVSRTNSYQELTLSSLRCGRHGNRAAKSASSREIASPCSAGKTWL